MICEIAPSDPGEAEAPHPPPRGTGAILKQWASRALGFDLRSLALLRIVAPSIYLWELILHWGYLGAMYTDGGMLPRTQIFESTRQGWSLYLSVSGLTGVQLLYCCHMAAVLCLIVGWRTRWASLVCYVFTTSLQNRFPALPGWETEIRLLFLIGFFLPWGEWASLDARRRSETSPRPTFSVSAATVAWRLQVCILYLASGLLKGGPGWEDGTAVEVSLASDAYATPLGLWFLAHCQHFPQSLVAMNYTVPLVEMFSPLFLLSPWPWLQMAWVVVLWVMHAGFGMCLKIGMFSPICCACLLGFLPSGFWSLFPRAAGGASEKGEPRDPIRTRGLWESVFLCWVCLSMLTSALETLPEFKDCVRPAARRPWKVLGLEQHWGMFVPPPFEGGWHVIKGRTLQGEWVDLIHVTRGASEERPEWISSLYPGVRAYLFLASYVRAPNPDNQGIHEAVADSYRRGWEEAHPGSTDRIAEVEIVFFKRQYVPGKGFKDAERTLVYSHKY